MQPQVQPQHQYCLCGQRVSIAFVRYSACYERRPECFQRSCNHPGMRHTRCDPPLHVTCHDSNSTVVCASMRYAAQVTIVICSAGDVQPLALLADRLHEANAGVHIELVTHVAHKVCLL